MDFSRTMLIEIKRDIIEEAINRKGQKQNEPLDLLFQMAICAKKGNHVVWVPDLVSDSKLRSSLSALITQANVSALSYAEERHRLDLGRLNRDAIIKAVITYGKEQTTNGKIVINPSRFPTFQPYTELYLLVENLIDAEFYRIVLKFYRKEKGFASYECELYPLMGGGITTAKVIENEIKLCQHFCLAISDSDRTRPKGPLGETIKRLLETVTPSSFNCNVYYLDLVSEIENLIPSKIVRHLYPLSSGSIDIFTKGSDFFDMKAGLWMVHLLGEKDFQYWKSLLPEIKADFDYRNKLKSDNPRKKDFEESIKKNNHVLIDGFGRDLLKRVMNADENASRAMMQKNIEANHLLFQTQKDDLSENQQLEWERIGERMFGWACGMKAI